MLVSVCAMAQQLLLAVLRMRLYLLPQVPVPLYSGKWSQEVK